jgi:hypothetical protein
MRRLVVVLALLAAAVATEAQAQSHRALVMAQLDSVRSRMAGEGYRPERGAVPGDAVVGLLPRSGSVMIEVNLRAGATYLISGGCDRDCSDLDLRLLAPDMETVLDEDVAADDVPVLTFTARQSGPHLLAVMMPSCGTDLCYFGFRVFAR